MWLSVLESLSGALKRESGLDKVSIQFGGNACVSYPCIQLIRGNMTNLTGRGPLTGGTSTFFVDIWVKNDDANPKSGYDELNTLERIVNLALEKWLEHLNQTLHIAAKAEISEITADEEKLRPVCKSRYTIKMQYRKGK